jgi:hypothetical protein
MNADERRYRMIDGWADGKRSGEGGRLEGCALRGSDLVRSKLLTNGTDLDTG